MAKVPTTSPGGTQLSNPKTTTQSASVTQGQPLGLGKGLESFGDAISQVGEQYERATAARSQASKLKAENYRSQYLSDALVRENSRRDKTGSPITDTEDYKDYQADSKKGMAGLDGLGLTKSEREIQEILWERDTIAGVKATKAQRIKNSGIAIGVETENALEDRAEYFNGSDEHIAEMEKLSDDAVRTGAWNVEKANDETKKAISAGYQSWFNRVASADRNKAKEMLNQGVFKFDVDEKRKALQSLVAMKSLEDRNTMIDKVDNRYSLTERIGDGSESLYDLSTEAREAIARDDVLAEAIAKAQAQRGRENYSSDYTEREGNQDLVKVLEDASKATNSDRLSTLAASMLSRKGLTPDEMSLVLFYAQKKSQNLGLSERDMLPPNSKTTQGEKEQMQIDAGINGMAQWSRDMNIPPEMHGQAVMEYIQGVKDGKKPLEIVNQIMRESNLKVMPDLINYPEEGQIIVDAEQNMKIGYPTGVVTTISSKAKTKIPTARKSSTQEFKEGLK